MTGKYAPLEKFLLDLPRDQRRVRLEFEQIESILKNKLPASAYEDERWWQHATEGDHRNTRSWTNAGWRIGRLDVKAQWVEFVRARSRVEKLPSETRFPEGSRRT